MKKKICIVVASRANYGRIKSVLRAVQDHPDLKVLLVVSASALLSRFGNVLQVIQRDGFKVDAMVHHVIEGETPTTMAKSTGLAIIELATIFTSLDLRAEKTLVFALLGAEECGGYGGAALAEALEAGEWGDRVHIINLEGLGAGDGYYMDVWDLNYRKNRPTVEAIDEAASLLGVVLELGGADPGTSASTFFLFHIPAVTCDWSWFERDEHPDFHLPSDLPERINQTGLLEVTQVVAVATWILGG